MITTYDHPFLDNTFHTAVEYNNKIYPAAENAFQASKFASKTLVDKFRYMVAKKAQIEGTKHRPTVPNWYNNNTTIMYSILKSKFQNPELKAKLIATYPEPIIHINGYHDNEWGICTCSRCNNSGKNKLGILLIELRNELISNN